VNPPPTSLARERSPNRSGPRLGDPIADARDDARVPLDAAAHHERARPIEIFRDDAPRNPLGELRQRTAYLIGSRVINVALALVALVMVSPILIIVATLVKFTSRGPIFYRQTRVGLDRRHSGTRTLYDRRAQDLGGSVFTIYKFRSMRADAERGTGVVWAMKCDPRVTPVGRFLRKTRLDELPQLLNVIKGEMNIVGPRPERPSIFQRLSRSIEEYPIRQRAKPGITGWAQVNRAYDASLDDVRKKVQLDIEYIQRQSLLEDLRIMLKTVPVILHGDKGW
jgi:lipopolysaccharide/colanic/teichoic acid biosynthesis glycosyltransferase